MQPLRPISSSKLALTRASLMTTERRPWTRFKDHVAVLIPTAPSLPFWNDTQAKKDAEKAWVLVKARRLAVAANSNTAAPSCLQTRVAQGQPLPRVA